MKRTGIKDTVCVAFVVVSVAAILSACARKDATTREPEKKAASRQHEARKILPPVVPSIFSAAEAGRIDVVKSYLATGANPNARQNIKDSTSMRWAPAADGSGNVKIVEQTPRGMTALILAAQEGHLEVVRLLLDRGADVNTSADGGATALMGAVGLSRLAVAKLLIEKGADVNAEESRGWTPLAIAASRDDVDAVTLLLGSGADANARNRKGMTAMNFARTDRIKSLLNGAGNPQR